MSMNEAIGEHRVDRVLMACLAAMLECGRTPEEIRAGWARVSLLMEFSTKPDAGRAGRGRPASGRVARPSDRSEGAQ